MKTTLFITSLLLGFYGYAQEHYNFVPQYFYLHTQSVLLQKYVEKTPNTNPVFQPQYVAVDSAFIAQRREHLQEKVMVVNEQKLTLWERRKK